jgi:hypothetical protein
VSADRILCGHIKKDEKGKSKPCHRYLGDSTETKVFIRCPRCGGYTTIDASDLRNEAERSLVKKELEKALIKLSQKDGE